MPLEAEQMKIVHILPGSGGTFYCDNCMRDVSLAMELRKLGNEVIIVPMYLPLFTDMPGFSCDMPVFYGAVNVYLKQKIPLFRRSIPWMETLLNSSVLMKFAAGRAGSTRASGLGGITLSMLRGEAGYQASELEKLVIMLGDKIKPDVVHLSNALLLGLVRRIKSELRVPVICSLQDEDTWINAMDEEHSSSAWELLREKAKDVDAFIPVSNYYADFMLKRLQIPYELFHVVNIGIDLKGYEAAPITFNPPVIGYISRMSESSGLGLLVDAFLILKEDSRLNKLKLHAAGGYTGDDRRFIEGLRKKLTARGLNDDVEFFQDFDRKSRLKFLHSLSILSVPVLQGEAYGTYMIEALASGVPVVQPKLGAFPELIKATGGGIFYEPNDAVSLAGALLKLLLNSGKARELGRQGRKSVERHFSSEGMAVKTMNVYKQCTGMNYR